MAYVLSSVSGNLISAASAGFAPTNSADVSAIASSYQVVSSTATQLYAGTAYLTSVNEAPISAARAGNAANATLATSAYYDGTGRLISSLPDSAAVSAIASSYVESGVSSKQDTLSFAYNTADQISSINGSALGGMDEAAVSGIASAYAESAVSSKADSSALSSYALSADVSGTVDLVSTQSANWGGSALALSAGPGVKLTKSGDTLVVASTNETVLWSSTATASSFTLSESLSSFERVKVQGNFNAIRYWADGDISGSTMFTFANMIYAQRVDDGARLQQVGATYTSTDGLTFTCRDGHNLYWTNTANSVGGGDTAAHPPLYKVIGINRTAEA